MSDTTLVQQLRADMERATRDVRVPAGLGLRASRNSRRRRRRTRALSAICAATAMVAAAVGTAGLTGVFGSAEPHPSDALGYQTTASVLARVGHALNAASRANLVLYTTFAFTPSASLESFPAYDGPDGTVPPDLPFPPFSDVLYALSLPHADWMPGTAKMSYVRQWSDRSIELAVAVTASGEPDFKVQYKIGGTSRVPRRDGGFATASSASVVIYGNRTWWTASGHTTFSSDGACPSGPTREWLTAIKQGIACGGYKVVGHQVIDGIRAIKLEQDIRRTPFQTLWVSTKTYLPVRAEEISHVIIDYEWLRPTAASLAHLRFSVPAGFRKVPAP